MSVCGPRSATQPLTFLSRMESFSCDRSGCFREVRLSLTFLLCVEVFSSPLEAGIVTAFTVEGRLRYGSVIPSREGCQARGGHCFTCSILIQVFTQVSEGSWWQEVGLLDRMRWDGVGDGGSWVAGSWAKAGSG